MKKRLKKYCRTYMIRPILYKTVLKAVISLLLCAIWGHFFAGAASAAPLAHAAAILAVVFFAQAWFAFLRLDGVKLPRLRRRGKPGGGRRPHTGDIADYGDTDPVSFAELQEDERDFCTLLSALLCALLLLLAALFSPI